MSTPLTITLYGADDAPSQMFTRSTIPWGILKKAISLTKGLDQENVQAKDLDAIAGLVVEAFGHQFTVDDLDKGADIGEMLAVLQGIVARAAALVQANPTPASKPARRSR